MTPMIISTTWIAAGTVSTRAIHRKAPRIGNTRTSSSKPFPGHGTPSLNDQVLRALACSCLSIPRTQGPSRYILTKLSCFPSLGTLVPLYPTYLRAVTRPKVVNQFTVYVSPGFSPVLEAHRCTGLEHVSRLSSHPFPPYVARTTIHGQRQAHYTLRER